VSTLALEKAGLSKTQVIAATTLGTALEFYDFTIYSFFAIQIGQLFFPSASPVNQFLLSIGVFGVGFVVRPLGGIVIGAYADRAGRKKAMVLTIMLMALSCALIACAPTYAMAGMAAPFIVLAARLIQGFAAGGEFGPGTTLLVEYASDSTRAFFASWNFAATALGLALGAAVATLVNVTLPKDAVLAWGWRVPFVVGAMAALVALYLRRSLDETTTAETRRRKEAGTLRGMWKHKGAFFTVLGFTAGGSLIFYTFTTYMQKYLVNTAGMHAKTASNVMTGALFVYMIMQPAFGALSDRIGRRQSMLLFGFFATIGTVPLLHALKDVTSPVMAFVLVVIALAIVSFYTSISGLIKAEMFPPEVRALGVGLSYAVANAIFGGSAEYVALWLKQAGSESMFYWYVTVLCAIAGLVSFRMRDPSKEGYLRHEP